MSNLFIISTPIGNRKDITLRALETMFKVDILLCEDTRKTKLLLDFYREQFLNIPNDWLALNFQKQIKLISFYEEVEKQKVPYVLDLLKQGLSVGLVSNAGTPGISDPGFLLVKSCIQNNIPVITIPGPSALIAALSISGLSSDRFTFLGFLPKKSGKQSQILSALHKNPINQTVIFYESPFRIKKTLENIYQIFGDIEIFLARELTKVHEEIKFQKVSVWIKNIEKPLKGELVVLFRLEQS